MPKINLLWNNAKNYLFRQFSTNPGKFVVVATALSYASASIAQSLAIACNKKIPDKQKKFLIPQELIDGAVNVITSVLIIGAIGKYAGKLIETGKWTNHDIKRLVAQLPESAKVKMGNYDTNLRIAFWQHATPELQDKFYPAYYLFKGGMEILATTTGSIIACNIVSPLIRNNLAAEYQKRTMQVKAQVSNTAKISAPNNQNYNYARMYTTSNRGLLKI